MHRLLVILFPLCVSVPTQAATVRVRLAKSTKQIKVSGRFVCGQHKTNSPLAKRVGAQMLVDGQSVPKAFCSGRGRFAHQGMAWDGGAELRLHGTAVILIGVIDLETYIAGVVAAELMPGWPKAALKAMAVAARSYTMWRMRQSTKAPYHVTADVSSQVFRGLNRIREPVRQATRETRGQVLRYKGQPIAAYYHACAAGRTATAAEVWGKDQPYLKSVISPDLACNRINWRAAMHVKNAAKKLGIGTITAARITAFTPSNRVEEVELMTAEGARLFSGQNLRKKLGWSVLRSTDFSIRVTGRQLVFLGHGSGHGVGMSQWGAKGLALRGKDYRTILAHYYAGCELR